MTATISTQAGLRGVMAIAVLVAALLLPAQAFAASDCSNVGSDPTAAQYCSTNTVEAAETTSTPAATPPISTPSGTEAAGSSGSLPFTGFDAVALLAAAVALAGAGFALRRLSTTEN